MEREDYIDKINTLTTVIQSLLKSLVGASEKRYESLQFQVTCFQDIYYISCRNGNSQHAWSGSQGLSDTCLL